MMRVCKAVQVVAIGAILLLFARSLPGAVSIDMQGVSHDDIGRGSIGGDIFTFAPNLSDLDAAQNITPTVRTGSVRWGNSTFLTNGQWTPDDGATDGAIFTDGTCLVQIDLGSVIGIGQICTYSRHLSTRLQQTYKVFGSVAAGAPSVSDYPTLAAWSHIADVDSGAGTNGYDGVLGVRISDDTGVAIGSYRYLLFEIIRPPGTNETNYNEWDIRRYPPYCGGPETLYFDEDIDNNCNIALGDTAILSQDWLNCTNPDDVACSPVGPPGDSTGGPINIVNPGFETGDWTGWVTTGIVRIHTDWTGQSVWIADFDGGAIPASAYQDLGVTITEGEEYTLTFDWIIEWATGVPEVIRGKFIRLDTMAVLASKELESFAGTRKPDSVWESPFELTYVAGAAESGANLGIMIENPYDAWMGVDNVAVTGTGIFGYLENCAPGAPNNTVGDINGDCYVNVADVLTMALAWLQCSDPGEFECLRYYDTLGYYADHYAGLASARWHAWRQTRDKFPIAAWSYFNRFPGTVSEYTVYRDAGLSMVQSPFTQYNNAVSAGVKTLLGAWEGLWSDMNKLAQYVNYPTPTDTNVWGYLLFDEPHPDQFAALARACEYIYDNDQRNAIPIIDMLPNWAVGFSRFGMTYERFSELLVEEVHPAVMLNSHYAILGDGTDRPEYFENIELYRRLALEADIGLMGFGLVTNHGPYREPDESDMFWQAYTYVTYGAKGIWYYNYRICDEGFDEAMVTCADGTENSTYYLAQAVNAELNNIWPTFKHLRSTSVYHTAPIPEGTTPYTNGSVSVLTDFSGVNFLLGQFENMDDPGDNDVYLIVTNKRHAMNTNSASLTASAVLTVDPAYGSAYYYDPATGNLETLPGSGGVYTVTLGGGKGRLLRFSAD